MKTTHSGRKSAAEIGVNDPSELFYVVDDRDNEIGKASRKDCHEKRLRHRSTVTIVAKAGKILVMKRSPKKDLHPSEWEAYVGGHVSYGETYESAAKRELREETGLGDPITIVEKYPFEDPFEREMITLFYCKTSGEPKINAEEAVECKFVTLSELDEMMRTETFTPCSVKSIRKFKNAIKRLKIGEISRNPQSRASRRKA